MVQPIPRPLGDLAGPRPVQPSTAQGAAAQKGAAAPPAGASSAFARQVQQRLAPPPALKWSRHAHQRLAGSGRTLAPHEEAAIAAAVDRVAHKGGRDSLVLFGDLALVVNVPSRTVITAAGESRLQDGVFTQIDSAVIVPPAQQDQSWGAGPLPRKLPVPPIDRSGTTS